MTEAQCPQCFQNLPQHKMNCLAVVQTAQAKDAIESMLGVLDKWHNREVPTFAGDPIITSPHLAESMRAMLSAETAKTWGDFEKVGQEAMGNEQEISFEDWWADQVQTLAPEISRKAEEYGSNSLAEIGKLFARRGGQEPSEADALETGCAVYAYGKMQRVADAMLKGKPPSDDTIRDLMVYAAMSLFIRETGRWP